MSEAYLFAVGRGPQANAALDQALRVAARGRDWLGQVHWLGAPGPDLAEGLPVLRWSDDAGAPALMLRLALRELEQGACDLLLVGETRPDSALALLLGAPAAVGRWNLPPLARLEPLPVCGGSMEAALTAAMAAAWKRVPEEEELALALCPGADDPAQRAALTGLKTLALEGSLLDAPVALERALAERRQRFGLLAICAPGVCQPFLVERL